MLKRQQRNEILLRLQAIHPDAHAKRSNQLIESVKHTFDLKHKESIGITISRFTEVDTKPLIEWLWKHSIQVAVPLSNPTTKQMTFYQIRSWDDVTEGYKGLLEPIPDSKSILSKKDIHLMIVPGVVYDLSGYRIGFGGGFYDRFLKDFVGTTVSLAFEEQIVPELVKESHDIAVQYLVTEQRVINMQEETS